MSILWTYERFGFAEGNLRHQTENQKTRKFLKDVFRREGRGILILFHELRKITKTENQLKAGFTAGKLACAQTEPAVNPNADSQSSIFLNSFQSHQNSPSPSSERRIKKLSGLPLFCPSVRKVPSQFLIRQKERGALMAKKADDSGQAVLVSRIWSAVFLTIPDFRKKTWPELYQNTSLQPRSTAVFTIKSPFWFCSMRNCERDSTLEKRE